MAKKEKSKKRLDKFYHIAKEQGYRSRAAFKLIQLNKKYNFLQSANVLVDLCAAPGGWMQVASKYMPSNSIIIGVDLDPIKPVPNCKSFQEDITTPKCLATIRRELQGAKADAVLNDGAPNVGANWNRDAYVQAELVLASLKVACELLRKGGVFVTKVFRSADYHALIWVMSKFFDKVEATKPEASRAISAEIFVVGLGFQAPDYIDKKFFDPRSVFQDNEASLAEILSTKEVNSVDKVFEIRNRRHKTVTDSATQTTHRPLTLEQFVEMEMPYAAFVEFSRIDVRVEDREKFFSHCKFTEEMEESCKDLLILGKREIFGLVKWRNKVRAALHRQRKAKFDKIEYDEPEEEGEEEEDPGQELYKIREKERRAQDRLKEKQLLNYAKRNNTGTSSMVVPNELEAELQDFDFDRYGEIIRKGEIIDRTAEENAAHAEYLKQFGGKYHEYKKREKALNSEQEVMDNIEYIYEKKRARIAQDEEKRLAREQERREKKERHLRNRGDESEEEDAENATKMDRLESDTVLKKRALVPEVAGPDREDLRRGSKWFDRGIFDVLESVREEQRAASDKPLKKLMTTKTPVAAAPIDPEEDEEGEEEFFDDEEFGEEEFEDGEFEDGDEEEIEEDDEEGVSGDEEEDDDRADDEDVRIPGLKQKTAKPAQPIQTKPRSQPQSAPAPQQRTIYESNPDQDYEIQAEMPDEDELLADMEQEKLTKKDIKKQNRLKGEMAAEEGIEQPNNEDAQFTEYDNRYAEELTPRQKNLITIKDKKEKRAGSKGFDNGKIEVVPAKKFEDFDTEELAEDLALAKKMLRKKDREAILEMSFNKHNNFDYEGLPSWFVEDERKHHYINLPITKEEVKAIKDEIRTINERPAKKVLEAKFRKKKRLEKQLKKFKKQADAVFEDDGLDERSKGKEVRKLKSKIVTANKNSKLKKKTIVSKTFKAGAPSSRKTSGKKYQMVDSRSKKELRAMKRIKRQGKNYKAKGKRY